MKRIFGKRKLLSVSLLGLALLALVGTASAVKKVERVELRAGDLLIVGHGGFRPETLPKHQDAPIEIYGGGKLSTISGDLPPILKSITFEFDRHGSVETEGLAVCTKGQLIATDVPAARRACGDAIVGRGAASATVVLPEQAPISASSGITFFNGPKKGGDDTIIAHAHLDVPAPTTIVVPIVIEKIHKGIYGYRTEAKIPKLVNGYGRWISGSVTIGRKWTFKGKKHSYVNARCETGRLQARGEFSFEGTLLKGTFFRPCKVLK